MHACGCGFYGNTMRGCRCKPGQIEKFGSRIEVAVPDEPTKAWLKSEYELVISKALSDLGVEEIRFVVYDPISKISGNRPRTM